MALILGENLKPPLSELAHHGVKGMHWGIRKEDDVAGRFQSPDSGPNIDPRIHPTSQDASREVSRLIQERYGYKITNVHAIAPGHPEYENGTLGYVQNNGSKKPEGVVYVALRDTRPEMKAAEKAGWVANGCGTPTALLTHEAGHAIFHSRERYNRKGHIVGGDKEARVKAGHAMFDEANRKGIPDELVISKVSGYAHSAGNHEEIEAELFSQYHWAKNPPSFVKVWGETLHNEMGIDGTPFRERR